MKSQQTFAILLLVSPLLLFQNCSEGFRASHSTYQSVDESSQIIETVNTVAAPTFPGVHMTNFRTCYAASTDPNLLATCLTAAPNSAGMTYTAATITSCQTAGNTSELHLAHCLSRQGQVIQDHREARQFDFTSCTTAVGVTAVADCLGRRGLRQRVQQTFVDRCLASDGAAGLERCLRRSGYLSRRPALMQTDATLCEKVEGGTTTLALCLQNADLLPVTVTQAQVDACVTAVTSARVVRCLRVNYHVSRALMQSHINDCNVAAGQAGIANCLDVNGLLPVDPVTQLAAFQTEVDGCVTAVTLASVAKCLRGKNLISPRIMQPHIVACFNAVGVNAFNCLNANFILPTGFTDAELKSCFSANMGTSANAARCLMTKKILPGVPLQDHITACNRFAGQAPDATGTRPGQVGIAACLNASGLLVAPLAQANIDTCVTNVGLANVATCLHNQGIVPSYSRMVAAGGVFTNCTGCHNATLASGNLNVSIYSSVLAKVVPGNSAASVLNLRINAAATPMPPSGLLAQALRDPVARWIDQGANDN